jgi:hypothetical protein
MTHPGQKNARFVLNPQLIALEMKVGNQIGTAGKIRQIDIWAHVDARLFIWSKRGIQAQGKAEWIMDP